MTQTDSQMRLKSLLRELFQLDVADLDFGLYRLFRLKRDEVEAFLNKQLPAEVDRAFEAAAGAEREAFQKRAEELAQEAREAVADDAVLPSGDPNPEHASAKAVKAYAEARKRLQAVETSEAQRSQVFNILYAFFSRYYDAGDFIPRRFYGARGAYAVPYNGEEVLFHWANKDQHYVKSGEAFRDYAFTVSAVSGLYRVRFTLVEATAPKDNTKGDTRFFFPLPKEVAFDKATRTITVPFHYRLPTEAEVTKYGKNAKAQEAILDEAAPKILGGVPDEFLRSALSGPSANGSSAEGEEPPTLLGRRLSHFTKKNTTDYFVHKDLGAFLRQELEFFVRDQVVHEADLEGDFDAKRRTIRVFRKLAATLITFLAQVEDAQKRLFEKKKFVLRTDYLVPIRHVPRALWPDVLANKAQLAEWKNLFALEPKASLFNFKGQINESVLEQHPTLVVDTKHFYDDLKRHLLASFNDLDETTDGVLIHGENFQALRLMQARYREHVKCIYIDPPYNTGVDGFIYKDRYQHSAWIAMMEQRLREARALLAPEGIFTSTVDFVEVANLRLLCDRIFGSENFLADVAWEKRYTRSNNAKLFYSLKDTLMCYRASSALVLLREARTEKSKENYTNPDKDPRGPWISSSYVNPARKEKRPNLVYKIWNSVKKRPVEHPTHAWKYDPNTHKQHIAETRLYWGPDGSYEYPRLKTFQSEASEGIVPVDMWSYQETGTTDDGGKEIKALFGEAVFDNPKPSSLVMRIMKLGSAKARSHLVLDFFAGSGTTGDACLKLSREDGVVRRFVLVEMARHFDGVLVPRIQKVMFAPEWKDGKPARLATKEEAERTPRLVKVLRLESYEDALHNTFSDSAVERLAEREKAHREAVGDEEYRVRYLVKLPLEASDSMLNLAKLEHPFDYTLEVLTDHGPRTETVDLAETFNWLYGLRVHRLLAWANEKDKDGKEKDGRSYRAVLASDREGKKRILVVWRDMTGLDPKVERPFLEAKTKELGTFEEQWINGDTAAKGFASLDGLFKRLMEEGER